MFSTRKLLSTSKKTEMCELKMRRLIMMNPENWAKELDLFGFVNNSPFSLDGSKSMMVLSKYLMLHSFSLTQMCWTTFQSIQPQIWDKKSKILRTNTKVLRNFRKIYKFWSKHVVHLNHWIIFESSVNLHRLLAINCGVILMYEWEQLTKNVNSLW